MQDESGILLEEIEDDDSMWSDDKCEDEDCMCQN